MTVISSYKVEIVQVNQSLNDTLLIYRKAVSYLISVTQENWSDIKDLNSLNRQSCIEKLVHTTKKNVAFYDFDTHFYKFPSYLRRSAIQDAVGIVSSYQSNLSNYNLTRYEAISNGKRFQKKAPTLRLKPFKCPALYKGNMFQMIDENHAQIKVYHKNDWVWRIVTLKQQDVNYIKKYCSGSKEFSPLLVKKGHSFYLQFAYEKEVKLTQVKLQDQKVLAVDLGVNHSAVCSILDYKGTILGRKFINQPREKDLQIHLLNRIKLKQKQSYFKNKNKSIWAKCNNLNEHIINNTVHQIINYAKENQIDVIIFEYLDFKGKKRKTSKLGLLQMWAYKTIQKKLIHHAHKNGIRYARVNAKNTSALAFDGSGKVTRNKNNQALCTFKSGKQYNCDLSASYNIGARYFITEIIKTLPEKVRSLVLAKVPELMRRTCCTLATLFRLVTAIQAFA